MNAKSCDNCNRIIDTVYKELTAPTVFGESIGFAGNLCIGCISIFEYCVYQYLELFDHLDKRIKDKMFRLNTSTQRKMK